MNAEDDPERRIRELERPLADSARASELGAAQPAGGYTHPSGPSGPSDPYPSPWAGAPIPPPPGNRAWSVLGAVFVIGVLALVGGIAAFAAHRFSRAGSVVLPTPPSISRGNTLPGTLPRQTPSGPSAGPSTPPPGGNLSVAGINENQTIACNDSIVHVSGVSNMVVITGHCTSVSVSGVQNSITVDAADTIDASGFNNKVTYHTGSPKVSKSGDGNVVQQG